MKKLFFTLILVSMSLYIFGQAGTVISGMPTVFGFGSDDKQDSYAPQGPHQWKNGQGTACWDYTYAYLVPGWADNWGNGPLDGAWAKNELQYWESRGQIQVFTYYYSYGDKALRRMFFVKPITFSSFEQYMGGKLVKLLGRI